MISWSSNKTWVANAVLAAADLNTYLRDQLNALGAMYGMKQRVLASSATSSFTGTSSSYADITNATLSITTTGGRLVIYQEVVPAADGYEGVSNGAGTVGLAAYVKALCGATDLGGYGIADSTSDLGTAGHRQWSTTPVAGTYTVKLQYKIAFATNTYQNSNMKLVAEEWGLVSA